MLIPFSWVGLHLGKKFINEILWRQPNTLDFTYSYGIFYSLAEWSMKWKVTYGHDTASRQATLDTLRAIRESTKTQDTSRLLFLCNHVNTVDGMHCAKACIDNFPDHRVVMVVKEEIRQYAFFSLIEDSTLYLSRTYDKDKDYMEQKIRTITEKYPKTIVLFFPEGTTHYDESVTKGIAWCESQKVPPFKAVIPPRYKGLDILLRHYKPNYPDGVLMATLTYPDDPDRKLSINLCQVAISQNPRVANFEVDTWNVYADLSCNEQDYAQDSFSFTSSDVKTVLMNQWRKVDERVDARYRAIHAIHDTFADRLEEGWFHMASVPMRELGWYTSRYLMMLIPLTFMTHGLLYGGMSMGLLYTSYQYHIYHRMAHLDKMIAVMLSMWTLWSVSHKYCFFMFVVGTSFFIFNKWMEWVAPVYQLKMHTNWEYFRHSMLHIMTYSSIVVEFMLAYGIL